MLFINIPKIDVQPKPRDPVTEALVDGQLSEITTIRSIVGMQLQRKHNQCPSKTVSRAMKNYQTQENGISKSESKRNFENRNIFGSEKWTFSNQLFKIISSRDS